MIKLVKMLMVAAVLTILTTGTSFALPCSNVTVAGVATTSTATTPSGMSIRLVPAQACGTWAAGQNVKFFLSTENTDRTLAVILTAMSLGKTLWVDVAGTTDGSLVNVVNMTN